MTISKGKWLVSTFVLVGMSWGAPAFSQELIDECKSRSAGKFFTAVPAQCLYDPANRAYVYKGVDCFSCKRIRSANSGNQNFSGQNSGGRSGSDTPGGGVSVSDGGGVGISPP